MSAKCRQICVVSCFIRFRYPFHLCRDWRSGRRHAPTYRPSLYSVLVSTLAIGRTRRAFPSATVDRVLAVDCQPCRTDRVVGRQRNLSRSTTRLTGAVPAVRPVRHSGGRRPSVRQAVARFVVQLALRRLDCHVRPIPERCRAVRLRHKDWIKQQVGVIFSTPPLAV